MMGYYGASVYRGDYYGQRGDFYRTPRRGDPGFFDFISDVGKGIVGVASKVLPYAAPVIGTALGGPFGTAIGGIAGGLLGKVLSPGAPIQSPALLPGPPPIWAATAPGTGSTLAMIPATPQSFTGVSVGGAKGLQIGKSVAPGGSPYSIQAAMAHQLRGGRHMPGDHHRRMNALNPRALSRALRRARGFQKYATKVLKLVGEKRHVDGFKRPRKGKR